MKRLYVDFRGQATHGESSLNNFCLVLEGVCVSLFCPLGEWNGWGKEWARSMCTVHLGTLRVKRDQREHYCQSAMLRAPSFFLAFCALNTDVHHTVTAVFCALEKGQTTHSDGKKCDQGHDPQVIGKTA